MVNSTWHEQQIQQSPKVILGAFFLTPLFRVNYAMQGHFEQIRNHRTQSALKNPFSYARALVSNGGIRSLWRGFLAVAVTRSNFGTMAIVYSDPFRGQDPFIQYLGLLALSNTIEYPLKAINTVFSSDIKSNGSYKFPRYIDVCRSFWASNEIYGFFRGWFAQLLITTRNISLFINFPLSQRSTKKQNIAIAAIIGTEIFIYPIRTAQVRYLMAVGPNTALYQSFFAALKHTASQGIKSMYAGFSIRIAMVSTYITWYYLALKM